MLIEGVAGCMRERNIKNETDLRPKSMKIDAESMHEKECQNNEKRCPNGGARDAQMVKQLKKTCQK